MCAFFSFVTTSNAADISLQAEEGLVVPACYDSFNPYSYPYPYPTPPTPPPAPPPPPPPVYTNFDPYDNFLPRYSGFNPYHGFSPYPSPVSVDAGPGHSIPMGQAHVHEGASARTTRGELTFYSWSIGSCRNNLTGTGIGCPTLSGNVSGPLSGTTVSNIPGPTYTSRSGYDATYQLRLRVEAVDGVRNYSDDDFATDRAHVTLNGTPFCSPPHVDLAWDAVNSASEYWVYRCTGASCSPALGYMFSNIIASVPSNSFRNSGLTLGTTYRYQVRPASWLGPDGALMPGSLSNIVTMTVGCNFDFSLATEGNKTISRGGNSVTNNVAVTLLSADTEAVSLSASGFPAGVSHSFSPTSCNPTCTSVLTMSASASTLLGNYPITVTGVGGSVTKIALFNLNVVDGPSASISVNPRIVNPGQCATLTWSSSNASSCSINPTIGLVCSDVASCSAGGSVQVCPSFTTTYTLTCTGVGGQASAQATVAVGIIEEPKP